MPTIQSTPDLAQLLEIVCHLQEDILSLKEQIVSAPKSRPEVELFAKVLENDSKRIENEEKRLARKDDADQQIGYINAIAAFRGSSIHTTSGTRV